MAAVAGGADRLVAVEASPGLANWTGENLRINGASEAGTQVVCQDPLEYLAELGADSAPMFDLIVCEPPRFGGKRRPGVWNVQDGHAELINRLLALEPGRKDLFRDHVSAPEDSGRADFSASARMKSRGRPSRPTFGTRRCTARGS